MKISSSALALSFIAVTSLACSADDIADPPATTAGTGGQGGGSGQAGAGNGPGAGQSGASGQAPAGASGVGGASTGGAGGSGAGTGGAGAAGMPQAGAGQGGQAGGGKGGQGGMTAECQPGEFSCLGDLLRQCNDQGAFEPQESCDTGLCDENQGKCLMCKPGSVQGCQGDARLVCDAQGKAYAPQACTGDTAHCAQGKCVACLEAKDCPASTKACFEAACVQNNCGVQPSAQGSTLPDPITGDCKTEVCDGNGQSMIVNKDEDVSTIVSLCSTNGCKDGLGTKSPQPLGLACTAAYLPKEGVCDGKGACVECIPNNATCTEGSVIERCDTSGKLIYDVCKDATPACRDGMCINVKQLAAGDYHTCALLSNKEVNCWGSNSHGQLGNGESGPLKIDGAPVLGLANVVSLAAGDQHSCAIVEGGKVFCWGNNEYGQLGAGTDAPTIVATPIEVKGLTGAKQINLGSGFSCAIADGDKVYCWGRNDKGQLGSSGPMAFEPRKTQVEESDLLAAGRAQGCVRTLGGKIYCWGLYALSNDQEIGTPLPVLVDGIPQAKALDVGGDHVCIHTIAQNIMCWDFNAQGQLGTGKTFPGSEPPTATKFPTSTTTSLALGRDFSCALIGGEVSCAGANLRGQLGRGYKGGTPSPDNEPTPASVVDGDKKPITEISQIVAGKEHACALGPKGVMCWGDNTKGQFTGTGLAGSPDPIPYAAVVSYTE